MPVTVDEILDRYPHGRTATLAALQYERVAVACAVGRRCEEWR